VLTTDGYRRSDPASRFFNWLGTMVGRGKLQFKTPMLFCVCVPVSNSLIGRSSPGVHAGHGAIQIGSLAEIVILWIAAISTYVNRGGRFLFCMFGAILLLVSKGSPEEC